MAANDIKQRITLEGEKEYNAALKDAQRNLRTLKSELKAETAELGANATAQQKNEVRVKSLKAQIQEQEKVVHTLRDALEQAKAQYGDNAEVVAKWEQKLNNARTSLANMKNDLEGVGTSFNSISANAAQATVATKSVADSLNNLGSIGDSISGAIESIFGTLISKMEEAVEKLWGLMTETAAKANQWTDLGNYFGSSAQDMQKWERSISAAGGSFDKFISVVSRLAFGGNDKKITELLGISKEQYEDDVQYALAVLDELERRRTEMSTHDFDDLMSDVFGARRSQDVMWFLNNAHNEQGTGWRDNPEQWNGDNENSIYGQTSEELGTMNELYIVVCRIEEKWKDIKAQFAAGLGGIALNLLVNVEGALDGIAAFMNAKDESEKQAALNQIRENLEEFFRKLGEIIRECAGILNEVGRDLQGSDDPMTRMIGDILVSLTNALQWLVDHQNDVKTALEVIFGVWLIAKLGAIATKLAAIIAQIELVKAFSLGSTVTGGATGAALAGTGGLLGGLGTLGAAGVGVAGFTWLMVELKKGLMNDYEYNRQIEKGRYSSEEMDWMREFSENVSAANAGFEGRELTAAEERVRSQRMDAAMLQLMGHFSSPEEFIKFWNFEDSERGSANLWLDMMKDASRGYSPWMWQMMSRAWGEGTVQDLFSGHYNDADWLQAYTESFGRYSGAGGDAMQYGYGPTSYASAGLLGHMAPYMDQENLFGRDEAWATDIITNAIKDAVGFGRDELFPSAMFDADWWSNQGSLGNQDNISGADLRNFNSLPGLMAAATGEAVGAAVGGIKVELDGATVGYMVAPYVSEFIARSITA